MTNVTEQTSAKDNSNRKDKKKLLHIYTISLAIIVLLVVFFLIPASPRTNGSPSSKINQMRRLVARIGKLETEVQEKRDELLELLAKYSQKTGEPLPALNGLGLSEQEKKIIKDKVLNEEDVSIKTLLEDILRKDSEISDLKNKMKKEEVSLPEPYTASEGENHFDIAMKYLVNNRGVNKKRALRLVDRAALFDQPLAGGFRVWNLYSGDEFATYVTKGDARVSPNKLRQIARQYLQDVIDRAVAEIETLKGDINQLKSTKKILDSQVNVLQSDKQQLAQKLKTQEDKNIEMEAELNSLFFMVNREDNFIKDGILKKAFLGLGSPRLKEIPLKDFGRKIDLSKEQVIEIDAEQLSLDKIRRITVYPKFYKRNTDYKIEFDEDKKKAAIKIVLIDKFKGERVVISVE